MQSMLRRNIVAVRRLYTAFVHSAKFNLISSSSFVSPMSWKKHFEDSQVTLAGRVIAKAERESEVHIYA